MSIEWIDRRTEEAIDPHRRIVDAHHHLWDRGGSRYLAEDLTSDTTGSHDVIATVFVECLSKYARDRAEPMQPVGETEFVAAQAVDAPQISGIVSHADMMLGAAVGDVLAAHDEAGAGRFRGIRHATSWHADDAIPEGHSRPFEHMMATSEFRAGLATLASMGFSFDAWLFHTQLDEVAAAAEAIPELTIVLNHLGAPLGIGPFAGRREAVRDEWRAAMRRVARHTNVVLKVGGIGMARYYGMEWAELDRPPSSERVAEHWSDDVRFCIDLFGPDRCLMESNFPVDRETLPYPVLWNALQIMASGYTDAEQDLLFSGTAERVYRLDL